ncbi:MAG: hypothetical protein M3R13_11290 [Armatimonadota bacterium]|nr:hypothetical protein [Armatimonadota bacterium]
MPLVSEGRGLVLWISKQTAEKALVHHLLDKAINSRIEKRERWQTIGCPPRDHQVSLRIELVSPQASSSKWFVLQVRTQVDMETAREDQDARCAPTQGDYSGSLVSGVMNAGN